MYYGPEFRSQTFDAWAYARGVKLEYTQPGKLVQNSFIESLNGSFRDGCLNQQWFTSLRDASHTIEAWREDYHGVRPHSSLGQLTPWNSPRGAYIGRLRPPPPTRPRLSGNHWAGEGGHLTPTAQCSNGVHLRIDGAFQTREDDFASDRMRGTFDPHGLLIATDRLLQLARF